MATNHLLRSVGIIFNVIVCFSASIFSSNDKEREHRDQIHDFFSKSYGNSPLKKKNKIISICSFFTLAFFSIGPGLIFGNLIFGSSDLDYSSGPWAIPSLWAYQIIWWAAGVFLIWFLANKMDLSTLSKKAHIKWR